jgi:glycosyltransferase involved in cell wall biosynthesis
MPKLSIIIPTYNNARYLDETLESIYRQTFQDYEIIVVDDGSTDNTQEVLVRHAGKIRSIWQENSGGCSKPRNEGIYLAQGEYIAIFDADDLMEPEKLTLQAEFLDTRKSIDFVFTDFRDFRGEEFLLPHTQNCRRFRKHLQAKDGKENQYIIRSSEAYRLLFYENFIGASTMMFRRALLDEIGLFDEVLPSSEDLDFTFRVTNREDIGFIDRVCHQRRLHATSMSTKTERVLKLKIEVRKRQLPMEKDAETQGRLEWVIGQLYFELGRYYKDQGWIREALYSYKQGWRFSPMRLAPYRGLARTLFSMERS